LLDAIVYQVIALEEASSLIKNHEEKILVSQAIQAWMG
jgi:hypothetical protein